MLLFSVLYASFTGSITSIFTGAVGGIEVIYSLSQTTTERLQNSRGDLAQLQTAFYAWTNEVYHWNLLLATTKLFTRKTSSESDNPKFDEKVNDLESVSKYCRDCTTIMLQQINKYAQANAEGPGEPELAPKETKEATGEQNQTAKS